MQAITEQAAPDLEHHPLIQELVTVWRHRERAIAKKCIILSAKSQSYVNELEKVRALEKKLQIYLECVVSAHLPCASEQTLAMMM